MAIFEIEAPDGRVFELEGDSAPNEQELEEIYANISKPQTQAVKPMEQAQETTQVQSNVMPQTQPEMTWGEAGRQALSNLIPSTVQMGKDIGSAVTNPVETAKGVYGAVQGGLNKIISPMIDYTMGGPTSRYDYQDQENMANALGNFYKQRYGGAEQLKRTLASDPAGALGDLSTVLTLGGGAVSKVGTASKLSGLAKAGRAVSKVGSAVDPINAVGKLAKLGGRGLGSVTNKVLGLTTGAGSDAIGEAVKAGRTGNLSFIENLRGKEDVANVIDNAKEALAKIKEERNAQYASEIGKTINDPAKLSVMPIHEKTLSIIDDQYYKNMAKSGKATMNKVDEMTDIVAEFEASPELHTAGGFDALKQRIADIDIPMENKKAERVRTSLVNTIKDTIQKQSPQYAKTMKDYSNASDLVNELEKSLSLGNKSMADTTLRKLQSVMRNNVNSNFGYRRSLIDELAGKNPNIMPSLAGQALSSYTPRGLQGLTATGAGVTGVASNPLALATLPAFSPRIVGEGAYLTGKAQKTLGQIPAELIKDILYQSGRVERVTNNKKNK